MQEPLRQSEAAADEREMPVSTVLVVEDEEPLRNIIEEMLQSKGFHVLAAASAEDAVQIAGRLGRAIDVLLTDLSLPNMDGYSLAARLAGSGLARRVIYMSGYTEANPELIAPLAGHRPEYIEKPFRLRDLAQAVCRATEG